MANISSSHLSPASRETVERFASRSEFYLQLPGDQRHKIWQFDGPDASYSYTGPDIVKFTEANCLAATAAIDDNLLHEFRNKLRTEWASSQSIPYEGMALAELISEYVVWVDYLFFFGILTHAKIIDGKLEAEKPLYTLVFQEGLYDAEGNELEGVFFPDTVEMHINLLQSSGQFQPLDRALAVIVHEMTHMYLDVLTRDTSHASYYQHVFQNHGHGIQFHELLRFNLVQLSKLAPMPYLGYLAAKTHEDLRLTLAQPAVSDAEAKELIGCGVHHR
ncbi:hypothetical protein SLS62_007248 [Diatrype stigma]|uniref:Uncharacterized protein n=1 Tax=Diatrype stigma TaxID=117547 RepID=A0AAN9ULL0_9PEZI